MGDTRPRIRTLKPEHRTHRKIGPLDHVTYRLWVGMLLEADDDGRLICDVEALRVGIFGYHVKVHGVLIESSLSTLAGLGLLKIYTVEGVRYACFPSWHDHQVINRPTPSRLPAYEDSVNNHGGLTEDSRRIGSDRIGSGTERIKEDSSVSGSATDAGRRMNGLADAESILSFLNQKTGRNFRAREASGKPSANLALIAARLAGGATVIQCRAIILRKYHEWKGDETMAKFLRPETLFGRSKFEQYLGELPARAEPPG